MRSPSRRPPHPSYPHLLAALAALMLAGLGASAASAQPLPGKPLLRAAGRHFTDPSGRAVILRGVNLAGNSKVPPFLPYDDPRALDPLPALGFNVVRLVFIWEAFEPRPGEYDVRYLKNLRVAASECWKRGLYVILDVHQDGYSRYLSRGSGDGFPPWSISPKARLHEPDNGPECANWAVLMATDPGMHRSFADFYSDANGVRTRYLLMLGVVARAFAPEPGVIGYDLLNEPWGNERKELAPLYRDAARAIRAEDPTAILFVEGHISTNSGLQTRLPRPEFDNFAYAPHYYKPPVLVTNAWRGSTATIRLAFSRMILRAASWDVPLFIGEFGAPAEARHSGDYVSYLYDRLDAGLASGAQWNVTPGWDPIAKDGWNGEDFSLLDPSGHLRPNFRPRPYPRATSGLPLRIRYVEKTETTCALVEFSWTNHPALGETEVFLPAAVFPPGTRVKVEPSDTTWRLDPARQILSIRSDRAGLLTVSVVSP